MKRTNLEALLKGLDTMREAIISELGANDVAPVTETVTKDTKKVVDLEAKKEAKEVKEDNKKEVAPTNEGQTLDVDVESLSYNELKKMAKDLGLGAKGNKTELMHKIEEYYGVAPKEEEEEDADDEAVDNAPDNVIEEDEEGDVEADTNAYDEIVEALGDYTDEELKELLESIGKSTKGKRQTLLTRVVQAVEDGELDFGDDEDEEEEEAPKTTKNTKAPVDEEEDEETDEDEEDEVEETDEANEEEEEDGIELEDILADLERDDVKAICRKLEIKVMKKDTAETLKEKILAFEDESSLVDVLVDLGYLAFNNDEEEDEGEEDEVESLEPNYTGSKARIKAMKKVYKETIESIEDGTIKPKAVTKLLKDYHNDTWKGTSDENKLEYARIMAELVDDEGDQSELGEAYYVGDEIFCCGAELKEVDDELYCEHCGTSYDNEEE